MSTAPVFVIAEAGVNHNGDLAMAFALCDAARAAGAGIASVTATCLELLGYTPPTDLAPSLVRFA